MFNGVIMFANNPRCGFFAVLALLAATCGALAEPVKITFLPPPMEGTISLGVYDDAGKLVRVLHSEDPVGEPESKLTKGDDGLVTQWDGKDDQGKPCAPGSYHARGIMVGDLDVDGVGFVGNDWVDDEDTPRFSRICELGISGSGTPVIRTLSPQPLEMSSTGPTKIFTIILKPALDGGEDPDVQLIPQEQSAGMFKSKTTIEKGKILSDPIPGLKKVTDMARGVGGTLWVAAEGTVRQYSKEGKLLRTVASEESDPPAVTLTASTTEEKVYVLYQNATLQRLRGYDFTGVKPEKEAKELFEQDIHACDTYKQIASELKFPNEEPFVPSPTLTVTLVPNPLTKNKPGTLEICVGVDKEGCYLATADGLLLGHISDTKKLLWAVMGRPAKSNAITVFDSDGTVVEQFQIAAVANMMAFDAGTVQWPGESASPSPSPTATPSASPTATPPESPSATPAAPAKR